MSVNGNEEALIEKAPFKFDIVFCPLLEIIFAPKTELFVSCSIIVPVICANKNTGHKKSTSNRFFI
jgi:hypothetical protein